MVLRCVDERFGVLVSTVVSLNSCFDVSTYLLRSREYAKHSQKRGDRVEMKVYITSQLKQYDASRRESVHSFVTFFILSAKPHFTMFPVQRPCLAHKGSPWGIDLSLTSSHHCHLP